MKKENLQGDGEFKMKPKVTAMMLTHNRKEWLKEAIKSILEQTYKNFELIIIDNASTDGTREVVDEFINDPRIVYVRNEENLYPYAKNQVVDLARGEYIAICDDDDISFADRFEKCVEFFESNPDVDMVFGDMVCNKKELGYKFDYEVRYPTEANFENIYNSDGIINTPTVMMRKKAIEDVNGYDNDFKIASDYDLYLRISKDHKIGHIDNFLAKYRIHDDNASLRDLESTAKYRDKALLKWAKVSCMCFSYNRVFQLESYIRSFLRFVKGIKLNVRYQYSEDKYKKGYEELKLRYPEVNFIEGHGLDDFEEQVLDWMKDAPDFVMFGCDDCLFKDPFDADKIVEKVKLKDTIGFGLRLGKGLTYHFPTQSQMSEPDYEEEDGILRWKWRDMEHEYGYPFELGASVYKKEFVEFILDSLKEWGHPNLLEGLGYNFVRDKCEDKFGKYLYAFEKPKAIVIQINRVQDVSPNPFFNIGYDIDDLHDLWLKGERLDLDHYKKDFNCVYSSDFVLELSEKISVIIPVYNQNPNYFREAVESVVNQTIRPHEIIIVDDGSNPKVSNVLSKLQFKSKEEKKIPLRILRNEKNLGIGASRKRGVERASGDYIAFLSSDDVWDEKFLETMLRATKQYPDKILYSGCYTVDDDGKILKKVSPPNFDHEEFCIASWEYANRNQMFCNFSTTFFPKAVFKKVQFDKTLRFCEDLDFLLRSMKHFEYQAIPGHLLRYRITGNLTSRILDKIPKQNEKIRKKCMEYWND